MWSTSRDLAKPQSHKASSRPQVTKKHQILRVLDHSQSGASAAFSLGFRVHDRLVQSLWPHKPCPKRTNQARHILRQDLGLAGEHPGRPLSAPRRHPGDPKQIPSLSWSHSLVLQAIPSSNSLLDKCFVTISEASGKLHRQPTGSWLWSPREVVEHLQK